jgi:hypothetical protein
MATWKAVERKIAALLKGVRVPITGRIRGSAPDIQHELWSIEVKHRESLPDWLMDAFAQADASNDGTKIPLVILHQKGQKFDQSLALTRLENVVQLQTTIEELERRLEEK